MMPAGENQTPEIPTSISEDRTSENPTSIPEDPTSETPTSPPPESQWRREWKPPGKLGYEDYARSMGLQTSAYKRLCKLARDCMKDVPAAVTTSRWDYVEEATKATCYLTIHKRGQEADIAIRRDFDDIVRCLHDENILEHFAHEGWYRVRDTERKKKKKDEPSSGSSEVVWLGASSSQTSS
ncbi:hypothetical protein EV426DRAFT_609622, partial [Tirmania nivea]